MTHFTRTSLLTSLLFISAHTNAQFDIEWKLCLGGIAMEEGNAIIALADGGYVFTGWADGPNPHTPTGYHGGGDLWTVRLDAEGAILWQRYIGGSDFDTGMDICQVNDGGFIVVGSSSSANNSDFIGYHGGYSDAVVMKLDSEGNTVWQRCMGGSAADEFNSIEATPDGGAIVIGATLSTDGDITTNQGTYDLWVVKLAANGATEWQRTYGGSQGDFGYSIKPTSDGGYIAAGETHSNNGDVVGHIAFYDAWVLKLSSAGALEWQLVLGGNQMDDAKNITLTADGGYILAGTVGSSSVPGFQGGGGDLWVVKISADGQQEWQRCLGGSGYDGGGRIAQLPSGNFMVLGSTESNNGDVSGQHGEGDLWAAELDANGAVVQQQCLGGSEWDSGSGVALTPDGTVVLLGNVTSNNGDVDCHSGDGDAWVIKLVGDGTNSVAGLHAHTFHLAPNPATTTLTLHFSDNARPTHIRLRDAQGRMALELPAALRDVSMPIDVQGLASGTYMAEVIHADGTRAVERFVKQ